MSEPKNVYRLNILSLYYETDINLREKIYLILSLASMALLFYSIWQIRPIDANVTDFLGMTSHLTIIYWIGLLLITICSILIYFDKELKNILVHIVTLIIFGLFILAIPIFVEYNAYMPYSYYPAGEVNTVLKNGHIDMIKNYPLIAYRQWPAIHFITANIIFMTGAEFTDIIKYMPLLWIVTFILISFSIGRALNFSIDKAFLLSLLGVFSLWIPQYYYSPQSFAFLAYLFIFWIFLRLRIVDINKREYILLLAIFFILVVTAHMLTSIVIFLNIIALWLYYRYKKNDIYFTKIVWLYGIILSAWYAYLAPYAFRFGVHEFIKQATQLDLLYFQSTMKFASTSPIKDSVNNFRLIYLIIYLICFITVFVYYNIYHKRYSFDDKFNSNYYWLIGIIPIVTIRYGAEVYERAFMFSIIPLMALMILILKNEKFVLILFLLLLIPHIPAHYGSQSFELTRTTDLKGSEFFASDVVPNSQYFYFFWNYIAYYDNNLTTVAHASFSPWKYPNITILDRSKYIIKSTSSDYMIRYYINSDPLEDIYDKIILDTIMIYDNGDYKIHVRR